MTQANQNNDDPMWDVFGSDDDDDDDNDEVVRTDDKDTNGNNCYASNSETNSTGSSIVDYNTIGNVIANALTKHFLITTKKSAVPMSEHSVAFISDDVTSSSPIVTSSHATAIENALHNKQITNFVSITSTTSSSETKHPIYDACIVSHTSSSSFSLNLEYANRYLLMGGYLILIDNFTENEISSTASIEPYSKVWKYDTLEFLYETSTIKVIGIQKWPTVPIQNGICRWLPSKMNTEVGMINEMNRTSIATVPLSGYEIRNSRMTKQSLDKAVHALQQTGVCILPGLLRSYISDIQSLGQASLQDLHTANTILKQHYNTDIRNPSTSSSSSLSPPAFQEMSMREDYRVDIRFGPKLNELRSKLSSNTPITVTATTNSIPNEFCLRGNPDILEILRRTMNHNPNPASRPVNNELAYGNFGRYNFSGTGPDGSYQDLTLGVVGSIISMPGSADQAYHADTPHLFECLNVQLPAHYINIFTPSIPAHPAVGQTAFVLESHTLPFTAKYCSSTISDSDSSTTKIKNEMWENYLIRPALELGDVVLFDCRIVHFGMSNAVSSIIDRPLVYCNATMHWFTDPKNWSKNHELFSHLNSDDTQTKNDNAAATT